MDVIPDAKVRIYPKNIPSIVIPPVVPVANPVVPPVSTWANIVPPVVSPVAQNNDNLVTKNTILNLSKLTIPVIGP